MLSRVAARIKQAPLAFSIAYGGAKTIAADVLVQKYMEGREEIDTRRSLVFLGFGCFQVGFVQYMIYSKFFPFIFKGAGSFNQQTLAQMAKDTQGIKNVFKQVAVDMTIYHPCCYFPVFYTCQEIVNGNVENPARTVSDAISKYVPNAVDDWIGLWKIFVPVSLFQNSFCPVYLRVPCVATAGFFYCIILSMTRGDEVNTPAKAAQKMKDMTDTEFEKCVASICSRFSDRPQGLRFDEFAHIMDELGLGEASKAVFDALDDSDGAYPRGSGLIDAVRLADGLKLLADKVSAEERLQFVSANPRFVPENVPARVRASMSDMSTKDFESCLDSIRDRQWTSKDGIGRDEFGLIMLELGLGPASEGLFEVLDGSDGLFPRGSGIIDLPRFLRGMELLAGRCSPEERLSFIAANPRFLEETVPPRQIASEGYK